MNSLQTSINFLPWVGCDYSDGGIFSQKVLVLGESHYCTDLGEGKCSGCCKKNLRPDCISQTKDVVEDFVYNYCGERYQQTLLCFERAVIGKALNQEEREEFWNSIIYYNYLQQAQSGTRTNGYNPEEWAESEPPFREILEKYSPDCIIVWGKRLYQLLPNWDGEGSTLVIDNGDEMPVWTYEINGKKIPALCIYHPSTPCGKSWTYWHQFHKKFLKNPKI